MDFSITHAQEMDDDNERERKTTCNVAIKYGDTTFKIEHFSKKEEVGLHLYSAFEIALQSIKKSGKKRKISVFQPTSSSGGSKTDYSKLDIVGEMNNLGFRIVESSSMDIEVTIEFAQERRVNKIWYEKAMTEFSRVQAMAMFDLM